MTATKTIPSQSETLGGNIEVILAGNETEESISSLETIIAELEWVPKDAEKFALLKTSLEKPEFFQLVVEWGAPTPEKKFNFLVYLFEEDEYSQRRAEATDNSTTYCEVARQILAYYDELLDSEHNLYENGGNILHAACGVGTRRMTQVVIETLKEKLVFEDLITASDRRGRRPITLAVKRNDVELLGLMAPFDDDKRLDHILDAVHNESLSFLQVLLRDRDDRDILLNERIYESAAKAGDMGIWTFLAQFNSGRAKRQENLRNAVEHRKMHIVRHIVENYPEVLRENGHQLLKTTTIAVEKSRDRRPTKGAAKDRQISERIEDFILDRMVRDLDPRVVQACWPREEGRAAKEVSLELDLRSPMSWKWFAQIVKAAEQEVRLWQEQKRDLERRGNDIKEKAEMERQRQEQEESRRAAEAKKAHEKYKRILDDMEKLLVESKGRGDDFIKRLEATKKAVEEQLKSPVANHSGGPSIAAGTKATYKQLQRPPGQQVSSDMSKAHANSTASRYNIDFQPYLKSVTIPNLDQFRAHACAAEISHLFGSEVKHILQWLHYVKGVKKVLKLRVQDSRHCPHSEETIEEAIKNLDVEELDWKRLGLSIRTVQDATSKAHTLHLYSDGSWTPVYHWMGKEGIDLLKESKIQHLGVTIIKDSESGISPKRLQDQDTMINDALKKAGWKNESEAKERTPSDRRFTVRTSPWAIAGPPAAGNRDVAVVRDPKTVIRLGKFVPRYQKAHQKERARRIRVAILDSGVDQGEFEDTKDLTGQSFSGSHWWLSSEQHGTQMAKIISAIDPCCKLWIAKVADHRTSITTEAVIEALQRATEQNVDVISMSFALNGTSKPLETAVEAAVRQGIVLVCSTPDEGDNRTKAWPASCADTLAIAACNDAGEKLVSSTTEANYYFRGENVLYEHVVGAAVAEKISGSSVATAIAAGVASLCLSCCDMDRTSETDSVDPYQRRRKVEELFNQAKEGKYVRPWILFGETRRGDGESMFLNLASSK